MSAAPPQLPLLGTLAVFRQFSVPEYHKLIEIGVLTEDDNLELLEGYLVNKMSRNPPHDWVIQRAVPTFAFPMMWGSSDHKRRFPATPPTSSCSPFAHCPLL